MELIWENLPTPHAHLIEKELECQNLLNVAQVHFQKYYSMLNKYSNIPLLLYFSVSKKLVQSLCTLVLVFLLPFCCILPSLLQARVSTFGQVGEKPLHYHQVFLIKIKWHNWYSTLKIVMTICFNCKIIQFALTTLAE